MGAFLILIVCSINVQYQPIDVLTFFACYDMISWMTLGRIDDVALLLSNADSDESIFHASFSWLFTQFKLLRVVVTAVDVERLSAYAVIQFWSLQTPTICH